MDYSAIISAVSFDQAAVAALLIFGAFAGVLVAIRGASFLLDAISNDSDDDESFDDESDDLHAGGYDDTH